MPAKDGIRRKRQSPNQRNTKFVKVFVSPTEKKLIHKLAREADKSDSGFCADILKPIVDRMAARIKEEEDDEDQASKSASAGR